MKKRLHLKKKRKKRRNKKIIFIIVFLFSICLSYKYLSMQNIKNIDEDNLKYLIDKSYKNKNDYSFFLNKILKLFKKDLDNPNTFLSYSSISSNKKINKSNDIKEEYKEEDEYKESDYEKSTSYIEDVNNENITDPVVYIYNTHQLETYSDLDYNNQKMTPNVMMASYLLSDKLNKKGVKTIWEDTNMGDFIKTMNLPPDELYGASRVFIKNAKEKYPSLKFFIDLHRDSVDKDISSISINNVSYARVLFVLGVTNKTYQNNEEVMKKISDDINTKYNKLSRGIYERPTPDWYEAYNQDIDKNCILIELGAKDNTMNEVLNTIDVLSESLSKYVKENL